MRKFLTAALFALLIATPAQAAPVAIAVGISAASGALGVAAGFISAGAAFVGVAATAIAATANYFLTPKPSAGSQTAAGLNPGFGGSSRALGVPISTPGGGTINAARSLTVRQALPPRRFIYGRARVSGPLLFQDVVNPDLFMAVALSDGPISGAQDVYIGETLVPLSSGVAAAGTRFASLVTVEYGDGAEDQNVSALLAAAFPAVATSDYRQQGIARAVLSLDWGSSAENHNYVYGAGFDPVFDVEGVLIGDPRDETLVKGDPSNYAYSDNPALCVLHACVNAWHSELDYSDFNLSTVETAADDCDDVVTTSGGDMPIFRCAGIFQADAPIATQIADMLSSFNGVITFNNGLYEIHADKDRSSVHTFTDADFLGLEDYQFAADPADVYDAIKGVYFDVTDAGRRAVSPTYEVPDTPTPRETSIELPFTPDSHSAQILAYRSLHEARGGGAAVFRLTDAALFLTPPDVFTIELSSIPQINGEYKCIQVDLAQVGCIVVAKKKVDDAYTDPSEYLQ